METTSKSHHTHKVNEILFSITLGVGLDHFNFINVNILFQKISKFKSNAAQQGFCCPQSCLDHSSRINFLTQLFALFLPRFKIVCLELFYQLTIIFSVVSYK